MDLEALGNVGDFIGGIAVVITLVYLTFQIRHNTATVRASTIQASSAVFAEVMDLFTHNASMLETFAKGSRDFDDLTSVEKQLFASIMGSILYRIESILTQYNLGNLPREMLEGASNRLRGSFALPGTQAWWARGKSVFTIQFQQWIDEEIIPKPIVD